MNPSSKNKKQKKKTNTTEREPSTISEANNHSQLRKTMSNLSKNVKDRLIVWNCCFCPGLKNIECCNSCEVDIQSQLGF